MITGNNNQSKVKKHRVEYIRNTLVKEAEALQLMAETINVDEYEKALSFLLDCSGHVVVCGIGKSGHIGRKISATLASTGTPSFFLHPSEAFHGDLGMITRDDVIILISNSGETDEVLQLIPSLQLFGNKLIGITSRENSTLAKHVHSVLLLVSTEECCPNNLAPTTSTTLTLALGDALAVALMHERGFQPTDFARFHPGGALGRKLLTKVKDVMITENLPLVEVSSSMNETILIMNQCRRGVAIITENNKLAGIITDGDLRRAITKKHNLDELKTSDVMTREPKTCSEEDMLADIEHQMLNSSIRIMIVIDEDEIVKGILEYLNVFKAS